MKNPLRLPVYFDNHATTPVDPRVVEAMMPYFTEKYGNAASKTHSYGWDAEAAVGAARNEVARLVNAAAGKIVFTSGATESNNLAIKGIVHAAGRRGAHIVTAATEHPSVLDPCRALQHEGCRITVLPVDRDGMVDPDEVGKAITADTVLVSIMLANNEIGTIARAEEIGRLCASRGIPFHTDASQAAAYIPIDVRKMNITLMSLSAHKMYGPKGIGALYIGKSPKTPLSPLIHGGGHERGYRPGTLNVPAIVGFGKASAIVMKEMESGSSRLMELRERFIAGLRDGIPGVRLNGHASRRLPNNISVTFPGISAETLMMDMKDIAVSAGSACSSEVPEPSHVLSAIGLSESDSASTIRIGLGRFTTDEEIDYGVRRMSESVQRISAAGNRPRTLRRLEQVHS